MPGQEKMVLDYYQKNPSASQSIKGALYEEKIISLFKSKIKLFPKKITSKEAEKIITEFNKPKVNNYPDRDDKKTDVKAKDSSKKIDKKRKKISKK